MVCDSCTSVIFPGHVRVICGDSLFWIIHKELVDKTLLIVDPYARKEKEKKLLELSADRVGFS